MRGAGSGRDRKAQAWDLVLSLPSTPEPSRPRAESWEEVDLNVFTTEVGCLPFSQFLIVVRIVNLRGGILATAR